jgi:ABC-type spermidine/putrescine transport system permease subunit II
LYSFYIAIVMLFMLTPILMIIPASFASSNMFSFPPEGFTLKNYAALLKDSTLLASVGTTLYVGVAATVLATAVGVLAALGIVKGNLPCKDFLESFFLGPLIVPLITTGIGFLIFFVPLGLLGSPPAIILAHSIIISPYVVRIACASLRHSDPVLEEAAIVHGADAWDVFRTVILPQMRPSLISGALLAFLVSMDEYTVTVFLVQVDLVTMPIRIFQYIMLDINPVVTALASVAIMITGLLVMLLEKRYNIHRYLAL